MYTKNNNNVIFFHDPNGKNTEKMFCARVSESINTGRKDANGKAVYEYENWPARFIGKAKEKAEKLADKTPITLTEWAARNPYNKEKGRSFPYLLVMDLEVREAKKTNNSSSNTSQPEQLTFNAGINPGFEDFEEIEPDDLPF